MTAMQHKTCAAKTESGGQTHSELSSLAASNISTPPASNFARTLTAAGRDRLTCLGKVDWYCVRSRKIGIDMQQRGNWWSTSPATSPSMNPLTLWKTTLSPSFLKPWTTMLGAWESTRRHQLLQNYAWTLWAATLGTTHKLDTGLNGVNSMHHNLR